MEEILLNFHCYLSEDSELAKKSDICFDIFSPTTDLPGL